MSRSQGQVKSDPILAFGIAVARRPALLVACLLSGCAEPQLATQPLPPIVEGTGAPGALPARELMLSPGEHMSWDVRVRGISVGTAELAVSADEVSAPSELAVTSRFRTNHLASSMFSVEHRLITVVRGSAPTSSIDDLVLGRAHRRIDVAFDAGVYRVDAAVHRPPVGTSTVHTLHSALGWLRSWAAPDAEPGRIEILHRGELYRLELGAPTRETAPGSAAAALRVDCHALPVGGRGDGILLTVWLSDDERRLPLRIDAVADGMRVLADLIQHDP